MLSLTTDIPADITAHVSNHVYDIYDVHTQTGSQRNFL